MRTIVLSGAAVVDLEVAVVMMKKKRNQGGEGEEAKKARPMACFVALCPVCVLGAGMSRNELPHCCIYMW